MRALKIAAWAVGGLIALVIVALLLVVLFVDPNDFRDDVERVVEQKTGRELTLSGDLDLSIFPWLALRAGPAMLGDAPGFGDEPFAAIEEARVGVRLLPLLRGQLEVGNVRLAGVRVRLVTDAQGRNNWDDLGAGETAATTETAANESLPSLSVAGLQIENAALTIENHQDNTRRVVRDFHLETGRLVSGEPFDLETQFVLEESPALTAVIALQARVTADLERNVHQLANPRIDVVLTGQGYPADGNKIEVQASVLEADIGQERHRLNGLALKTLWKGDGFPANGVPVSVGVTELLADLAAQTLQLSALEADIAGARVTGGLQGEEILDAPRLAGALKLAPVSLREWLPKLGVELPVTRDPEVLKRVSFDSQVKLTAKSAELEQMTLQLDDTTARGALGVVDFDAQALRFDLTVDRIDADRYLPPPVEADSKQPAEQEAPTPIPVEMLRSLNARGQLQIDEAIFAGMTFSKLRLGLNARDGKVRFNPAEASMYGGQYSGDIGIDATADVARITLDEHVTGVDFAPLFKDLFETDRVIGKGNANIKLSGAGRDTDEVMRTLDGTVDFSVTDGALVGADLWYEIRRARALLKQQAVPERTGPAQTAFNALQGTGVMKNGVLTNNDLVVAMEYLRVTGQGTINIPDDQLDYRLNTIVLKIPREGVDATQMQELVDAEIPVRVTGTLTDPKVRPDIEGYLKGVVKERLQEEREKVEEKVKEKIGDRLRDILGR